MSDSVLSRLRPELAKFSAYAVPDANGFIKLDAMENPYRWPAELNSKWQATLSEANINRYPEPNPEGLKASLKKHFGPVGNADLLLGNGSDELIQLLVLAIATPGASTLTVSPSFSMYELIAQMIGVDSHSVALGEQFELSLQNTLAEIKKHDPSLVFLAYPNNPTGNLWSRVDVEEIIHATNGIVVLDEAYGPFASDSFVEDLSKYPNMLVLRTASKLGLAGVRFGWLTGDEKLIAELNKLRLPYNINLLTQLTMEFALENYAVFAEQAKVICESREKLLKQMSALSSILVFPSEANFILFKCLQHQADDIFQSLLAQKILIKNLSKQSGLDQCLRVTVGTPEENQAFLDALKNSLV